MTINESLKEFGEEMFAFVKTVEDFPKPGVKFLDLAPVYQNSSVYIELVNLLGASIREVDYLVVPESRGYILGGVFAAMQGCGLVIARKSGKTPPPFDVVSADSEYATSEYHFPSELDLEGKKVAIYDDVIATGSTIESLVNFVRTKGGNTVQIVSVLVIDSLVGDNMNTATQELFDIPLTTVKHC